MFNLGFEFTVIVVVAVVVWFVFSRGGGYIYIKHGGGALLLSHTDSTDIYKMAAQRRRWCFTVNNYTEEDCAVLSALDCKSIVVGKEVGETGTLRLQGFVKFKATKRLSAVKKISPKAHWEQANRDDWEHLTECSKQEVFIKKGRFDSGAKGGGGGFAYCSKQEENDKFEEEMEEMDDEQCCKIKKEEIDEQCCKIKKEEEEELEKAPTSTSTPIFTSTFTSPFIRNFRKLSPSHRALMNVDAHTDVVFAFDAKFLNIPRCVLYALLNELQCRLILVAKIENSEAGINMLKRELQSRHLGGFFSKHDSPVRQENRVWRWGNCITCGALTTMGAYHSVFTERLYLFEHDSYVEYMLG